MRTFLSLIIICSTSINVFSQDCSRKVLLSFHYISLKYPFSHIKDNLTQQITEHSYSKLPSFSYKIGLSSSKKINYGFYSSYTSINYRLNYKFIANQADPYLLNYSIIHAKYLGCGAMLGKYIVKNKYLLSLNIFSELNFFVKDTYKHVFENGNYTKSNEILYEQKFKKYLPLVGSNIELETRLFKKVNLSFSPTFYFALQKFSEVSIKKNNIQHVISICLKYDL